MQTLSIIIQKGGVGKSTVARSLAVAAAKDGLNVVLLDLDAQGTAANWGAARQAAGMDALPHVEAVTERALGARLAALRDAGADLVILDTPPARSSEAIAAMEAATVALMPASPTNEALEQAPHAVRLAKGFSVPIYGIVTMATPNASREHEAARAAITAAGATPLQAGLPMRKDHIRASGEAMTAQEYAPDSTASLDVAALWAEVRKLVNL